MSVGAWLIGKPTPPRPGEAEASLGRQAEWEAALGAGRVPGFVAARLHQAATGEAPWLSTMTPAELLLGRSHGIRPVATVSGTCWFQHGGSWTRGHAEGWRRALARVQAEAREAGANAVVDAQMRRAGIGGEDSLDYTLVGTAVRVEGLPPSRDPVVATVPALEFVRLLEAGIVPVGIAVGAQYEWLYPRGPWIDGPGTWRSQPLTELGAFWESVRRRALADLRQDAARQGGGVLAHAQFGQLLRVEGNQSQPTRFLGRHIIVGTVIHARPGDPLPHPVRTVVDMRDDLLPLLAEQPHKHTAYPTSEETGGV